MATFAHAHAESTLLAPGTYKVDTGQSFTHEGKSYVLSGIRTPDPGQMCILRKHERDCGVIARAQLMDLTAGATLNCSFSDDIATCSSGGYDISAQMVHTGWAIAAETAPEKYKEIMAKAKARPRGMWMAKFAPPWPPLAD
ncbi:MAG: thermonuclease family protein [Hyphomicrobiales bacterium]